MLLWPVILVIHGASLAGCAPVAGFEGKPENITVMFLSPSEVRVSWTAADGVEKYDVSYKPTDASYRVVKLVAGNSGSVTLRELRPDTQYSVTVIAFRGGERFRSRSVVFRTLEMQTEVVPRITGSPPGGTISGFPSGPNPSFSETVGQVRGIEVGIVCLVLIVWVGSIALFFNRWGKIRMLLPYQPDYKDTQLKVPGTGACQPPCQSASASAFCCPQRYVHRCADDFDWRGRPSRSRINSAIYIATHHRSEEHEPLFDTSMSVVRKVKSADNLPTTADYNSQPGDSLPMTDYSRRHDVPVLSISDATDRPIVEQHL